MAIFPLASDQTIAHTQVTSYHDSSYYSLTNPIGLDWIGLSSVLRPRQHSIGYMGDGFYRPRKTQPTVSKY